MDNASEILGVAKQEISRVVHKIIGQLKKAKLGQNLSGIVDKILEEENDELRYVVSLIISFQEDTANEDIIAFWSKISEIKFSEIEKKISQAAA
ncbi:hypothetical protein COT95_01715 [Candidatus Falkowbacteria bacterium CG10_big_fil_rev_8_21_14_0_10_37_6]|uniref:Uncharacterized protein n=1 Tax=Candidatus Falkowbacteria bacterium CG10_big_fil_rev_8_21_14_0_10_37_6 TaxID=1974563 RepID=A0A2H0V720_9BACT|nr:MAG: hypothetical protein COT95_01715 [Candidatus Falkowbacteria bacterium CG10_big_fil_rev_8_21_14_0_10_37_6]